MFTNEGTGTLIVADINHLPGERAAPDMTRLWDKGAPLDARVLAYTAGDDYQLDERLVQYDVQASLAHARMLHDQQLLSAPDLAAITAGLTELGAAHARGDGRIELADEDGQTALEARLSAGIGEAGGRIHLGRSRNDQVLTALRLYLRDAAGACGGRSASPARSRSSRRASTPRRCPATPTCSRRCRARCRFGPAASPPRSATTPRTSRECCGDSAATRSVRPPVTARRACRWTGMPRPAPWVSIDADAGDRRAALARQGRGAACCSKSRC